MALISVETGDAVPLPREIEDYGELTPLRWQLAGRHRSRRKHAGPEDLKKEMKGRVPQTPA